MKYSGIEYDDTVNGLGLGAVFFTQYCPHHCKGCQNTQTWNKNGGLEFSNMVIKDLFNYYESTPFASRLTISGGEPLSNIKLTTLLIKGFKSKFPNKTIWVYTGFTYNQVKDLSIMKYIDVLVDGRYIDKLRDVTLPFRGSSNQRIIDVQKTIENNKVVILEF